VVILISRLFDGPAQRKGSSAASLIIAYLGKCDNQFSASTTSKVTWNRYGTDQMSS
jgi:hypothetical protein